VAAGTKTGSGGDGVMERARRFGHFWIDFIIGDAWEIAAGLAVTLTTIWAIAETLGGDLVLSFVLLMSLLALTWIALLRTTRAARRKR
jgi:hypothetical protein